MKGNYKFSELVYERPDFEKLQNDINDLTRKLKNAKSNEEVKEAIFENIEVQNDMSFHYNLGYIRNFQDNTDAFYEEELQKLIEGATLLDSKEWNEALVNSPFSGDIDLEFGKEFLDKIRSEIKVNSNGKELMVQEQILVAQYQKLKAGLKIEFDGKTLSEAQLNKYKEHIDREVRKQSRIAYYETLFEHKEEFEEILDKLVKVRIEIAKANGYDSYLDYMNEVMGRRGYGEKELNSFSQQVKENLVPFYEILYKAQANRLGIEKIEFYDFNLIFPDGNPEPMGNDDTLLNAAKEMYNDLSKESGDFFEFMLEHELIDVKASPNKISNMGFCTTIDKLKVPFIFGNNNKTISDVAVLTHEVGHAFQAYLAIQDGVLPGYYFGVNDIVEIPSKAMEQFTYPYAENFFGKDADKYRFSHLQGAMFEIGSFCFINEFETYLYQCPEATLMERAQEYQRVSALYNLETAGSEFKKYIEAGCVLFHSMAAYMFPKYVISYSLSAICAMEFKRKMTEDREKAWESYMKLCTAGGSLNYTELLKLADLSLPYEDGAVLRSTEYAKEILMDYIRKE